MHDRPTVAAPWRIRPRLSAGPAAAVLLALAAGSAGCGSSPSLTPTAIAAPASAADLEFCASEINRYRSSLGRPALVRSASLEANAEAAAEYDATVRVPHAYFSTDRRLQSVTAETAILWWTGFDVRSVIRKGLAQMWASGPATAHYDVLVGAFTQVGCGVFVNGSEVTVVQDFR